MNEFVVLGLVAVGLVVLVVARVTRIARTERTSIEKTVRTYVTALLSTLALGEVRQVVLVSGRPLPRLRDLSRDPGLVGWTSALPPDFELNSAKLADYTIGYILGLTRQRPSGDATIETVLRTKLRVNDALADVAFSLKVTTGIGQRHQLEIEFPASASGE